MTAAKVMDVNARLTDGQAADAVSAYTQVKKGRRSRTMSDMWMRIPRRRWRKS